jgi:hypothetical protein
VAQPRVGQAISTIVRQEGPLLGTTQLGSWHERRAVPRFNIPNRFPAVRRPNTLGAPRDLIAPCAAHHFCHNAGLRRDSGVDSRQKKRNLTAQLPHTLRSSS